MRASELSGRHSTTDSGFMASKTLFLAGACAAVLILVSGCTVISVATTAVSVGVTAGSLAVGAATTVAKGAVAVGSAVVGDDDD
jgi:hypothetical protein